MIAERKTGNLTGHCSLSIVDFRLKTAVIAEPAGEPGLLLAANRLAEELGLPMGKLPGAGAEMLLAVTPGGLELRVVGVKGKPVWVDFSLINVTSGPGRTLKQPIARAVGLRKMSDLPIQVIDATAGYGEDAWLMASLGCEVTAVERSGVMAALLRDGLRRMEEEGSPALRAGAKRIQVVHADSIQSLRGMSADVVYLDPMFPTGRKTAERKAMVVLRRLVGDDADSAALLEAALRAARRRVVVKRPLRAAPLAGAPPSHTHEGKGVRYDVYVTKSPGIAVPGL